MQFRELKRVIINLTYNYDWSLTEMNDKHSNNGLRA
jgi:hypothetical protein